MSVYPLAQVPTAAGDMSSRTREAVEETVEDAGRVDVSVLIPVLNEAKHLPESLPRMQRQQFDGEFELLFMDGGSTDDTKGVLERFAEDDPRIRVFDNPGRHAPRALNIGLRNARGEFVARMDAHTAYPENYLAAGVERLRRGDFQWVSGPMIAHGDHGWERRIARALSTWLGVGGATYRRAETETETDTGFTGILSRSTLEELGGWDEDAGVNEDTELASRLRKSGGRIVTIPEMGALYTPRPDLRTLARQYWRYGFYRARTSWKHPENLRRSHALAPGLALAVVAAALPLGLLSRSARRALVVYAAIVLGVSLDAGREDGLAESALIAPAFVTMHLAWGFGFVLGVVRFSPPFSPGDR